MDINSSAGADSEEVRTTAEKACVTLENTYNFTNMLLTEILTLKVLVVRAQKETGRCYWEVGKGPLTQGRKLEQTCATVMWNAELENSSLYI